MRFKQWWVTTRFYKWLQTFQHEAIIINGMIPVIESESKTSIEDAEDWFEKAIKEEEKWKERGIEFYGKFANRTMEEQNQNLTPVTLESTTVDKAEPTELEKVVISLQGHVDNLTTKLDSISEVAKKLNPTGFSSLVTNLVSPAVAEGTGIIDTIKKYVTDAEILAENIESVNIFVKKQV